MKSDRKLILMLSSLLMVPVAIADQTTDYTYLSAGAARDNSGWTNALAEKFTSSVDGILNNEGLVLKKRTMGGYLRGSYDLGDGLFAEMRLRGFNNRSLGYFAGLGYYTPMGENASFYVLAGLNQPNLPREVHLNAMGKKQIGHDYAMSFIDSGANEDVKIIDCIKDSFDAPANKVNPVEEMLREFSASEENQGETPSIDFTLKELEGKFSDPSALEQFKKKVADAIIHSMTGDFSVSDPKIQKEKEAINQSKLTVKSQIAPAIEIGSRIKLSDDFGVRLAYQVRWDRSKLEGKIFNVRTLETQSISETRLGLSHEVSINGSYVLNANWQAEAGYAISKMLKLGDVSPKAGHQVNVGLRYTF